MSLVKLRIKIKSLAQEARIIRAEECKFPTRMQRRLHAKGILDNRQRRKRYSRGLLRTLIYRINKEVTRADPLYTQLHHHRTIELRSAARSAILAYGMMRGRTYEQMEPKCHTHPDWAAVRRDVCKFGFLDANYVDYWIMAWKNGEAKPEQAVAQAPAGSQAA